MEKWDFTRDDGEGAVKNTNPFNGGWGGCQLGRERWRRKLLAFGRLLGTGPGGSQAEQSEAQQAQVRACPPQAALPAPREGLREHTGGTHPGPVPTEEGSLQRKERQAGGGGRGGTPRA